MKNIDRLCPNCMKESNGAQPCPYCGFTRPESPDPKYLHIGTRIMKRYLVGNPVDSSGDGVTYICFDGDTENTVWLREYCPAELCTRNEKGGIVPTEGKEAEFEQGVKAFSELTEKLKLHNDIPALLPVTETFEGNGTAYCIYESTDAITLREFLLRNGGTISWDQARPLFLPFLTSLSTLHSAGIYHYGISPETVLVTKDGKLKLTGFCTADARTANGSLKAQLFPGFAAVEQYGSIGTCGPWTDAYAVAAVLYRVLVGNPPVESISRVTNDTLTLPQKLTSSVPKEVTEALAEALQIMPEERTQNIESMRLLLASAEDKQSRKSEKDKDKSKFKSYMLLTTVMTILIFAAAAALIYVFVIMPNAGGNASSDLPSQISSDISSDVSSRATEPVGTVKVDSFTGKVFSELLADASLNQKYNFVIEAKKYSESYGSRYVISQSPDAGRLVDPDKDGKVTVKLIISLGSYETEMPNVVGLGKDEAIFALMKAGFQYDNISVIEKYDTTAKPSSVISVTPAAGEPVNPDSYVVITYNSYSETEEQNSQHTR